MKECTFNPEIDITARLVGRRAGHMGPKPAKGVEEFVLRQEAARQVSPPLFESPVLWSENCWATF